MPDGSSPPPLLLAGPTAVGKSEVALLLAGRLGGEIISVDSMQVYRGLDVGTAKPSAADRERMPHHLIDVVELSEPFDAARFLELARRAVKEIQGRGRRPILCGGTGLYFKAYLEGLGDSPPSAPALRAELERSPLPELLRELEQRDPATFEQIDRQNPRRVVRALEVIRLTGRPFSSQRAAWPGDSPPGAVLGLRRSAADSRARIDARVDRMFEQGLVRETESLLGRGLAQNRTAMQAIGYRQVVEHLRGARSLTDTIAEVKARTRQFAKRQMTWLRHQLPVRWIDVAPNESAESVADRIEGLVG
ncbi:MAG TPA: tRNA (adenosine(37)-N6)-dimethylallyltransferase MiaA [Verrucomicrobiae bacterium]|nr:tRNA (adenosine(37)-N6)-dimethylallyltransferase MiaA [Verrucomicrobiae bacterium]